MQAHMSLGALHPSVFVESAWILATTQQVKYYLNQLQLLRAAAHFSAHNVLFHIWSPQATGIDALRLRGFIVDAYGPGFNGRMGG